jgi:hypothetical protein
MIGARQQVVQAKFSASIAGGFALERSFGRLNRDFRSGHSPAFRIQYDASQRAAWVLRQKREWQQSQRDD